MKMRIKVAIGVIWLVGSGISQSAVFTNIYFPGSWPAAEWWTNSSLPQHVLEIESWSAENENWRRASNALHLLTTGGFGSGLTTNLPMIFAGGTTNVLNFSNGLLVAINGPVRGSSLVQPAGRGYYLQPNGGSYLLP